MTNLPDDFATTTDFDPEVAAEIKGIPVDELDDFIAAKINEKCGGADIETGHDLGDELLCLLLQTLGYRKTVEAWVRLEKWYA